MSIDPLPLVLTENFNQDMKQLSTKQREQLLYDLNHITREDIRRIPNFRADIALYKKYPIGDFRVFLIYCHQCFHQFDHYLSCEICDENNLERIIAVYIKPRKKLYRTYKLNLSDIEF